MTDAKLQAVLFDKDGTLTDFHGTWDAAFGAGLRASAHNEEHLALAAQAIHYDLDHNVVLPDSPVIAGTNALMAELLGPHVDAVTMYRATMAEAGGRVAPATGLVASLDQLQARRVSLGVATNDDEQIAREQLETMGIAERFDCVVGADSGFGAKPEPGMVHGALSLIGDIEPGSSALVGDSTHDLQAARAAGAVAVLVTNAQPGEPAAVALADVVIPTLAELIPSLVEFGLVTP